MMGHMQTGTAAPDFEKLYLGLRRKEGRIYSDEEVLHLPEIGRGHRHYKEWQIRKQSAKELIRFIKVNPGINILEVGCGNGWLSAKMAAATTGQVTGIDINGEELEQAMRVFQHQTNLQFLKADLRHDLLNEKKFDLIVFAAAVQYFQSVEEILLIAINHLSARGEIYILDSHFYPNTEIAAARQRTKEYYSSMGFEPLAAFYQHHSLQALQMFEHRILYNPLSAKSRFSFNKNPFFRILVKRSKLYSGK